MKEQQNTSHETISSTRLYTRKGSNRGNPQSTIMYRIQNIHTHSNGTTAPSRKSSPAHFAMLLHALASCSPRTTAVIFWWSTKANSRMCTCMIQRTDGGRNTMCIRCARRGTLTAAAWIGRYNQTLLTHEELNSWGKRCTRWTVSILSCQFRGGT